MEETGRQNSLQRSKSRELSFWLAEATNLDKWTNRSTIKMSPMSEHCSLSFSSRSANKFACNKVSDSLKAACPFYCSTTLIQSHQISATATITHFDVLFNSNCSAHSQILVCCSTIKSTWRDKPNHWKCPHTRKPRKGYCASYFAS